MSSEIEIAGTWVDVRTGGLGFLLVLLFHASVSAASANGGVSIPWPYRVRLPRAFHAACTGDTIIPLTVISKRQRVLLVAHLLFMSTRLIVTTDAVAAQKERMTCYRTGSAVRILSTQYNIHDACFCRRASRGTDVSPLGAHWYACSPNGEVPPSGNSSVKCNLSKNSAYSCLVLCIPCSDGRPLTCHAACFTLVAPVVVMTSSL